MKRSVLDDILHVCTDDSAAFLSICEVQKEGVFEVICAGELRNEAATAMEDELMALLSVRDVVLVNLQNVTYMGSSSLACLLAVQKAADTRGKKGLVITALSQTVQAAFQETGLQEILAVDPEASIADPADLKRPDLFSPDANAGSWMLVREKIPDTSQDVKESGAAPQEVISLPAGKFTVGRLPGKCDFAIPEQPGISAVHAAFFCESGHLFLEDMHSRNGTFVNGRKIPSQERILLHPGDKVRLCRERFTVQRIQA